MASKFAVSKGIAKPTTGMAVRGSGGNDKYPTRDLEVGEYFVVPKSEMDEGMTPVKFRNRINQAVRTFKQRWNKDAHLRPGFDEKTYVPADYTVILLAEPPEEHPDAWQPGDVGVWRDA